MPDISEIVAPIGVGLLPVITWAIDVKRRDKKHREEILQLKEERRQNARKKENEYLAAVMQELQSKAHLLKIRGILEDEKSHSKIYSNKAFTSPMSGYDMRNFPAFLERFNSQIKFEMVSIEAINNNFGNDIISCFDSQCMWADEIPPMNPTYWSGFIELAKAIKTERASVCKTP